MCDRLADVRRFYKILHRLEAKSGGRRRLASCDGSMGWPRRGVYFFFEAGEERCESGSEPRVVRVGTHALKKGGRTSLWNRLSQHRGVMKSGGGNHRGSVFRLHVGTALLRTSDWPDTIYKTWDKGSSAGREIRQAELPLEQAVSRHMRAMPFLWLAVEDEPGPDSLRGYIERNAIALLSNYNSHEKPIDAASGSCLGRSSDRKSIYQSGLWNVNHVTEGYERSFLDVFEKMVR